MKYYPASKRKEIWLYAITWMKLESMLSEISKTQNDSVRFHLFEVQE